MLPQFHEGQRLGIAGFCWKTILILVAMEKRCAPVPISPRFLRACTDIGWPEDPDEIAGIVAKYLLRNDEVLVLNRLRSEIGKNASTGASAGMLNP
jgi:hypothetical protein